MGDRWCVVSDGDGRDADEDDDCDKYDDDDEFAMNTLGRSPHIQDMYGAIILTPEHVGERQKPACRFDTTRTEDGTVL